MGYCVRLSGQKFRIPANKVEDCLLGITLSTNKWLADSVKDAKKHIKYFEHLPPLVKLVELVQNIWGFKLTPNKDNDIDKISYELEKQHDFDGFCTAMQMTVDPGSYLEFTGEDSAKWRYVFKDNAWKQIKPQVIWPE